MRTSVASATTTTAASPLNYWLAVACNCNETIHPSVAMVVSTLGHQWTLPVLTLSTAYWSINKSSNEQGPPVALLWP